jgi:hypothetical protein
LIDIELKFSCGGVPAESHKGHCDDGLGGGVENEALAEGDNLVVSWGLLKVIKDFEAIFIDGPLLDVTLIDPLGAVAPRSFSIPGAVAP